MVRNNNYLVDRSTDRVAQTVLTQEEVASVAVGAVCEREYDVLVGIVEVLQESVNKTWPLVHTSARPQLERDVDEMERGGG